MMPISEEIGMDERKKSMNARTVKDVPIEPNAVREAKGIEQHA